MSPIRPKNECFFTGLSVGLKSSAQVGTGVLEPPFCFGNILMMSQTEHKTGLCALPWAMFASPHNQFYV
ncbi:hypothetical protein NOR53_2988 [gamma proteobacterium NOR5-3]|nr:hypothetical protein NOR53_2988 [gamma proteobacterium NOR5-3]